MKVSQAREIDRICTDFEDRWTNGEAIPIELAVKGCPSELRLACLEELLRIEVELLTQNGVKPPFSGYRHRFPACHETIFRIEQEQQRPDYEFELSAHGERYEIHEEIARGGMGVILRARDKQLQRDVAIKVIHERFQGNRSALRRLEREATVLASLQYPGIVPIYDSGFLKSGSPFFAMKLVVGATLTTLLRDPAAGGMHIDLFDTVIQVCRTVAIAHQHGVVHRDLKPSNIMVGKFGDVYVMDWGLAGVIRPEASARVVEATLESDLRCSFGEPTVFGTPRYMAPEQGEDETTSIDPRLDVFSLGAILCEALVGRDERRQLLARSEGITELADRLLVAHGVDVELRDLVADCLATDPADRPADASNIVHRLQVYRQHVEQRAEDARLAQATAEAKLVLTQRRWRYQTSLAVLLSICVLGLVSHFRTQSKESATRQLHAERAIKMGREAYVAACESRQLNSAHWELAAQYFDRAETHLASLGQDGRSLRAWPVRQRIQLFRGLRTAQEVETNVKQNCFQSDALFQAVIRALRTEGWRPDKTSAAEVARQLSDVPLGGRYLLIDCCLRASVYGKGEERDWLIDIVDALEPGVYAKRIGKRLLNCHEDELEAIVAGLSPAEYPPCIFVVAASRFRECGKTEQAESLLRKAQPVHYQDFHLNTLLGFVLMEKGGESAKDSIAYFMAASAIESTPGSVFNLGKAYYEIGAYSAAHSVVETLVRENPDYSHAHVLYVSILESEGKIVEAEEYLRDRLECSDSDPLLVEGLGNFYVRQQRYHEAVQYFEKASQLTPDSLQLKFKLGSLCCQVGRFGVAFDSLIQLEILDPDFPDLYFSLGFAAEHVGRLAAAKEYYIKALETATVNRGMLCGNLGNVCRRLGQFLESRDWFSQALDATGEDQQELVQRYSLELQAAERDIEDFHFWEEVRFKPEELQKLDESTRLRLASRICGPLGEYQHGIDLLFDETTGQYHVSPDVVVKMVLLGLRLAALDHGCKANLHGDTAAGLRSVKLFFEIVCEIEQVFYGRSATADRGDVPYFCVALSRDPAYRVIRPGGIAACWNKETQAAIANRWHRIEELMSLAQRTK